jgi:hypothetical protein
MGKYPYPGFYPLKGGRGGFPLRAKARQGTGEGEGVLKLFSAGLSVLLANIS